MKTMNYIKRVALAVCCSASMFCACDETEIDQDGSIVAGFSAKTATFYENAQGKVTVLLSAPASDDITVNFAVQNENNVQENKDYILPAKNVLILKGQTTAEIEIDFVDDKVVNNPRSFELVLVGVQGLKINRETEKIQITLLDDESDASVVFENSEFSLREDSVDGVLLPLLLEGTPSDDIFVTVGIKEVNLINKAIEGKHFTIENKEIRIPKDVADLSGLGIGILPTDDSEVNQPRVFVLEITKIVGATKITEKSTCVVTIKNDDLGLSWGATTAVVEEHPDGKAVLKLPLRLLGDITEDLHIKLKIESDELTENTDYTITKELVIPVGQDSVEVEIVPLYNKDITPDKSMRVIVSEVAGHDDLTGIECGVTVYNYDTELSFGASDYLVCTGWGEIKVPISLSAPVHHNISILVSGQNASGMEEDISPQTIVIPAGSTTAEMSVPIFQNQGGSLYNYLAAPLSGIVADYCKAEFEVDVKITQKYTPLETVDHEAWTIAGFSSDNPGDGGTNSGMAAAAIDGNGRTYWHSKWSGGGSVLPQYIVVDLKGEVAFSQITVFKRQDSGNSDNKTAEVYIGNDAAGPWTKVGGNLSWPKDASPNYGRSVDLKSGVGRYLKVIVTEGYRNFGQISEIEITGGYK